MPWKASSVMEEKLRFILEYEAGEKSMTELCQRYDISRETGYRTLRRYPASGLGGLLPQSHAAQRQGNQTAEDTAQHVLELQQDRISRAPRNTKPPLHPSHHHSHPHPPPTLRALSQHPS